MLQYAREGDAVIVTAIDRLGRFVVGVTRTTAELGRRRIVLRTLCQGIDTVTWVGYRRGQQVRAAIGQTDDLDLCWF
jgi:DNA invertase Pin-like site-specific DNA recombinase